MSTSGDGQTTSILAVILTAIHWIKKANEYDQKKTQSHTADQPTEFSVVYCFRPVRHSINISRILLTYLCMDEMQQTIRYCMFGRKKRLKDQCCKSCATL